MATSSERKLSMKLFIDTKAGKVLFAEAEKDCVDFLFNILSLHVGTVIRLLKVTGMNYGCLPNLYDSVENLKENYISYKSKDIILLEPKCSVGITSVPFLVNDFPKRKTFYGCYNNCKSSCYTDEYGSPCYTDCYCVTDGYAFCPECKNRMSNIFKYVTPTDVKDAEKGFVKEAVPYMVMDDLVVKPLSTNNINQLLLQSNGNGAGVLQEQVVNFGMEEALKLLKASFETKAVLTNVFMSNVKVEK